MWGPTPPLSDSRLLPYPPWPSCARVGVGVAVGALGLQRSHGGQRGPLFSLLSVSLLLSSCFLSAVLGLSAERCWMRQVGLGCQMPRAVGVETPSVNTFLSTHCLGNWAPLHPIPCQVWPSFLGRQGKGPTPIPGEQGGWRGGGPWAKTLGLCPRQNRQNRQVGQRHPCCLPSLPLVGGVPSPSLLTSPQHTPVQSACPQ